MNIMCPQCQNDNAYFDFIDENGSHYICPDCNPEYHWVDVSIKLEDENENWVLNNSELAEEIFDKLFSKAKNIKDPF